MNYPLKLGSLFVLLLTPLALAQEDGPFAQGIRHLRLREYSQAERAFLQAVEKDPKHAEAWGKLGHIRNCQGRYGAASEVLNRAKLLNPALEGLLFDLGLCQYHVGRLDEAHATLEEAIKANPKDANAHWMAGHATFRGKNPDHAIEHFKRAAELAPSRYDPLSPLFIALSHTLAGRLTEAKDAFQKVIDRAPASTPALIAQSYLRRLTSQAPTDTLLWPADYLPDPADREGATVVDDALEFSALSGLAMRFHLNEGLSAKIEPSRVSIGTKALLRMIDLAAIHQRLTRQPVEVEAVPAKESLNRTLFTMTTSSLPRAEGILERYHRIRTVAWKVIEKARASDKFGDEALRTGMEECREELEEVQKDPAWRDALRSMAENLEERTKNRFTAKHEWSTAVLGWTRKQAARDKRYAQMMQRLVELSPSVDPTNTSSEDYLSHAREADRQGDFIIALMLYEMVLSRNPRALASPLQGKGRALARLGRYQEALTILQSLADVHLEIGRALLMTGRLEEAARELKTYVSKVPSDAEGLEILGLAEFYLSHWKEALEAFQRAIAIEPSHALFVRFHIGLCAKALGDHERAQDEWKACYKASPGSIYGLLAQGFVTSIVQAAPQKGVEDAVREAVGGSTSMSLSDPQAAAFRRLIDGWRGLGKIDSFPRRSEALALVRILEEAVSLIQSGRSLEGALDKSVQGLTPAEKPGAREIIEQATRMALEDRQSASPTETHEIENRLSILKKLAELAK